MGSGVLVAMLARIGSANGWFGCLGDAKIGERQPPIARTFNGQFMALFLGVPRRAGRGNALSECCVRNIRNKQ